MTGEADPTAVWQSEFGKSWTERHPASVADLDEMYRDHYGIERTTLNELFLDDVDRDARILEVGANIGTQLVALKRMGFENLHGVEILDYAVEEANERRSDIPIYFGEAGNLPFDDEVFDIVFTSGVLIHIPESDLASTLREITRCTSRYVYGFEYFAEERTEIEYRGEESLLWKDDFAARYLEHCDLALRKKVLLSYLSEPVRDSMFLLERV